MEYINRCDILQPKGDNMHNLTISKGFIEGYKELEKPKIRKLCEHKANTITIDSIAGVEYCNFCGGLGHYNVDKDTVEWKLPEFVTKQNYN